MQFELGIIVSELKASNKKSNKEDILFNKFLKKINGSRSQALNLSSFLSRYGFFQKSIDIYTISEKINRSNDFSLQKAQIYSKMNNSQLMLQEYLNAMEKDVSRKTMFLDKFKSF